MTLDSQILYANIEAFSFDDGDESQTFADRLARENGWSVEFAERAIGEYRRFMFLAVVAGHPVTPSDQVDQVWHLHLTYTRNYWDRFCGEVLGQAIHHDPTKGGSAEDAKYQSWYQRTKDSYRQWFHEDPPEDLWPEPEIRFGRDLYYQRVNLHDNVMAARRAVGRFPSGAMVLGFPALGLAVIFAAVQASNPGANNFSAMVIIIAVAIIAVIGVSFWRKRPRRRRDRSDKIGCGAVGGVGCGGSQGGEGSGTGCAFDGGGCGASGCGGGGCGGGGCGSS